MNLRERERGKLEKKTEHYTRDKDAEFVRHLEGEKVSVKGSNTVSKGKKVRLNKRQQKMKLDSNLMFLL